tara:strand:- start:377 stop:508 length:132 start_codon:yes stop_codon:yes gene_type:complete
MPDKAKDWYLAKTLRTQRKTVVKNKEKDKRIMTVIINKKDKKE